MPHYPKPFYRKPRRRWYVEIDGKQINLGPDRGEAFRTYHELMASPSRSPTARLIPASLSPSSATDFWNGCRPTGRSQPTRATAIGFSVSSTSIRT